MIDSQGTKNDYQGTKDDSQGTKNDSPGTKPRCKILLDASPEFQSRRGETKD